MLDAKPGRNFNAINLNEEERFPCVPDSQQDKVKKQRTIGASSFMVELQGDNAAPTHLVSF